MVIKRIVPVYILCVITHMHMVPYNYLYCSSSNNPIFTNSSLCNTVSTNAAFHVVKIYKRIRYLGYIYFWCQLSMCDIEIIKFTTRIFYKAYDCWRRWYIEAFEELNLNERNCIRIGRITFSNVYAAAARYQNWCFEKF